MVSYSLPGCVAKTGGSLVGGAFVLSELSDRYLIHKPQTPLQVVSLPTQNHLAMCPLVFDLPVVIPASIRDGQGTRIDDSSHNDLSMDAAIWTRIGEALSVILAPDKRLVAGR